MFTILVNIVIMVGLITLVFLSPACMNIGLVRVSNKDYKITTKELVLCCIPVFNHFYGWKKYSDSSFSLSGISSILLYIMISVRAVAMLFFFNNETIQLYTVIAFLLSILVFWICNAINIFSVLSDSGIYTFTSKLFNAFSVVIGHITVGYYMPRRIYYYSNDKKDNLYGRG